MFHSRLLGRFSAFTVARQSHAFHVSASFLKPVLPFKLADIGEGIAEVEILDWFVKEGDKVEQFDRLVEVQSDKATVEITAKYDGILTSIHAAKGSLCKVGAVLCDIDTGADGETGVKGDVAPSVTDGAAAAAPAAAAVSSPAAAPTASSRNSGVHATPAVRRISRENNVDLTLVQGTGKHGRILKEDVQRYIQQQQQQQQTGGQQPQQQPPQQQYTPSSAANIPIANEEDRVEPVRGIKRTMIKTMTAAATIPGFGYADEIRMDNLAKARQQLLFMAESRGVPRLTMLPFMIKAASMALVEYPILNSSLSNDLESIHIHGRHHIGVAMDTPQGLLVPSIKDVQRRSILDIANELSRLMDLGRNNKLGPEELVGATFTLSNIGVVGGTYMSPVILPPQVAIGAMGRVRTEPRYAADGVTVEPHKVMHISFTCDHRVIDGVTIASFSNRFKQYVESPASMLLDMS